MSSQYPNIYLYKRIVQSKLFIDAHFAESINLENISDEAYFSKFHFIRLFKNIYGKTPHQYLTHVRVEKAKLLLADGMSVADSCYAVGFDSISSFTGLFKKTTGETPAAYSQRKLALKADMTEAPLKYIPHCFALKNGWVENSNFQEAEI